MANYLRNHISKSFQGQGLVEYALLLSFIAVVAIGVLAVLSSTVSGNLEDTICELYQMGRDIECGEADPNSPTTNLPPTANFSVNCSGQTCTFNANASSDIDGTIVTYEWLFGDGDSGTSVSTTHTYSADGSYSVMLWVTDDDGARKNRLSTITVGTVNAAPVAVYSFVCTGLSCSFDASGSSDSDGTITGYSWQFGDGNSASGATTTHTYTSNGSYTVILTVTDQLGTNATRNQTITAVGTNAPPIADFVVTCTGNICDFDASTSTDSDGTIADYDWDFGDSSSGSGVSPSNTYSTSGSFTVSLTVTDDDGATNTTTKLATTAATNADPSASFTVSCTGLTCSVDASGSSDSDGTITGVTWAFGDGANGSGVTATHTYASGGTFTISLTVTDNDGATDTSTRSANPVDPGAPTASFTSNCTGLTCSFNASGSTDDGTIVSYAWNFGDGNTGSGVTTSRTYATASGYSVTLTVTDNAGLTDSVTQTVTPANNNPPTASFTVSCTNLECTFNASTSSDSDGTISTYSWNFGDGNIGSGVSTSHTYSSGGNRTVTLTVTDNGGATSSVTNPANTVANVPPTASFTVSCSGMTCSFNATASSDSDGSIATYAWNYGDGNTGSGVTSSRTYATSGAKTVTLTVTDNQGASSSVTATANPAQPTMHVSALSGIKTGERATNPNRGNWDISVTITVRNSNNSLLNNVTVSGTVDGATVSCTTSASGQCTVTRTNISKNTASVTYTVSNLVDNTGTHTYVSGNNVISSVTINK